MAPERDLELTSLGVALHPVGWQRRAGAAVLAASVTGLVWPFLDPVAGELGWLAALGGMLGTLVSSVALATASRDPGSSGGIPANVSVRDGALAIVPHQGDSRVLPLDQIEGGWREELADHSDIVVLRLKSGSLLSVRFANEGAAQELLAAVGADTKATAIQVARATAGTRGCAAGCLYAVALIGLPLASVFVSALKAALGGEINALDAVTVAGMFTALAAVIVWYAARLLPTATLTVGSDGVRVKRAFLPMRFIPFDDLYGSACAGPELVLETRTGQLRIGCQSFAAADAVAERIDTVRRTRERVARGLDLAILERGARSVDQWRTHLRSLAERGAHYREQAFTRSDLLAVAENASVAPERRVGAALALADRADTLERRRLRIATEACAHPRLRAALAMAAEGEVELSTLAQAMRAQA